MDPTIVRKDLNFIYHLYDSCNLNCKGCDHFSPVSKKGYPSVEKCEQEFRRFSEIMGDSIVKIGLMGGEPLLNPDAGQYLVIARKYFPKALIRLVTNGLLLDRQSEAFWKICKDNRIVIEYTKYPIDGIDYQKRREIAQEHGVTIHSYDGDRDAYIKDLYFEPFDLTGSQDVIETFRHCTLANYCIQLLDGRLYTCTPAANVFRLSDHYDLGIYPAPEDSLDIYDETLTKERVAKFLASPIPLCRFCDLGRRTFGHPWRQSQATVYEYLPFFLDVRAENEIKPYKNVLVYGAGAYADAVVKWLLNFRKSEDVRICVTKKRKETPAAIHGIPVRTFEDVEQEVTSAQRGGTSVLVATPKSCQIDLERMLVEHGFPHVYLVDTKALDEKAALAKLAEQKKHPAVSVTSQETATVTDRDVLAASCSRRHVFYGAHDALSLRSLWKPWMQEGDVFCDDDPLLQGQLVEGLPVLGTEELPRLMGHALVVLLAGDVSRVKAEWSQRGWREHVDFIDGRCLCQGTL